MASSLFDLSGRTALVTGSSQGLGLAMARGLGQAGASLVLNGRDEEKLERSVSELVGEGLDAHGYAFDVAKVAEIEEGVTKIEAEVGPIHILVNNAGIQRRGPLESFDDADWHEVMGINLTGVYLITKRVAKGMIARKSGKIINICSLMSEVGRATIVPYTASKGGVKMLTKGLATEWGKYNIQVNGIGPGYFGTEINRALIEDEEFNAFVRARTPAGRWGEPSELAGAAIFLASRASDFVSGQILYVDGGILAAL